MAIVDYESMMEMLRIQRYKNIANYDKVIDLGVDAMWRELSAQITSPDIDPTDIFGEEIEYLRDLEYNMKLMNICCLGETWEQDLYNFLKDKGLITTNSNDYVNTKRIFEREYPTCAISNYPLILEMRALINAIKHGEGNSLNNLRRMTSDAILADSNVGVDNGDGMVTIKKEIEFDPNTMTSRTLNVDGKLQIYSNALVSFWEAVFAADKEKRAAASRPTSSLE